MINRIDPRVPLFPIIFFGNSFKISFLFTYSTAKRRHESGPPKESDMDCGVIQETKMSFA